MKHHPRWRRLWCAVASCNTLWVFFLADFRLGHRTTVVQSFSPGFRSHQHYLASFSKNAGVSLHLSKKHDSFHLYNNQRSQQKRRKWTAEVDQRWFGTHNFRTSSLATMALAASESDRDESSNGPKSDSNASHSNTTQKHARSVKTISMPASRKALQVWKTIDRLEKLLLEYDGAHIHDTASTFSNNKTGNGNDEIGSKVKSNPASFPLHPAPRELVAKALSILKTLATQHEGQDEWKGILNKSTLFHEVEESILAIYFLQQELLLYQRHSNNKDPREIVLVDVCCGKGVFSLLASHVFGSGGLAPTKIRKIIMLDKDPKLRWDHIDASNQENTAKNRDRPIIECWPRFNLHEIDDVVDRLAQEIDAKPAATLAMVGIHLCKTLSPACIGIANRLGPSQCPHLVLAPCCLPRVVVQAKPGSDKPRFVEVLQHETKSQQQQRLLAKQRRDAAMVRGRGGRMVNFGTNVPPGACWKCGEFGHVKADCPSNQATGKPQLIRPPSLSLDVSGILATPRPFGSYCDLLATSIQRGSVVVRETGLTNSHSFQATSKGKNNSKKQQANNWNQERKSVYIVASAFADDAPGRMEIMQ